MDRKRYHPKPCKIYGTHRHNNDNGQKTCERKYEARQRELSLLAQRRESTGNVITQSQICYFDEEEFEGRQEVQEQGHSRSQQIRRIPVELKPEKTSHGKQIVDGKQKQEGHQEVHEQGHSRSQQIKRIPMELKPENPSHGKQIVDGKQKSTSIEKEVSIDKKVIPSKLDLHNEQWVKQQARGKEIKLVQIDLDPEVRPDPRQFPQNREWAVVYLSDFQQLIVLYPNQYWYELVHWVEKRDSLGQELEQYEGEAPKIIWRLDLQEMQRKHKYSKAMAYYYLQLSVWWDKNNPYYLNNIMQQLRQIKSKGLPCGEFQYWQQRHRFAFRHPNHPVIQIGHCRHWGPPQKPVFPQ